MYGGRVTTGVTSKLSNGGGEVVPHSSPVAPQGLRPASLAYFSDQLK